MSNSLCLLTHDFHPYGAQRLALSLAREWTATHRRHVEIVACGGGSLSAFARRVAPVTALGEHWRNERRSLQNVLPLLKRVGIKVAFTNTVIGGSYCKPFAAANIPTIALIHEMPSLIREEGLEDRLRAAHQYAQHVIYPHAAVSAAISAAFPSLPNWNRVKVMAQGIERVNPYRDRRAEARQQVRALLGIESGSVLILAMGTGDRRKGIDLFLDAAAATAATVESSKTNAIHFLWIGPLDDTVIAQWGSRNGGNTIHTIPNFHWLDYQAATAMFFAAADVFLLASREDPFPFVVLESLGAGVPVAAFSGCGGGADLASRGCGINVPTLSGGAMSQALIEYLANAHLVNAHGQRGRQIVDDEYRFDRYANQLLALADALAAQASTSKTTD